ncbi:MAG: hypothetical protein ACLS7B_04665 [Hominilimicola sp.]
MELDRAVSMFQADKSRDCVSQEHLKKPKILILDDSTRPLTQPQRLKSDSVYNEFETLTKIIIARELHP